MMNFRSKIVLIIVRWLLFSCVFFRNNWWFVVSRTLHFFLNTGVCAPLDMYSLLSSTSYLKKCLMLVTRCVFSFCSQRRCVRFILFQSKFDIGTRTGWSSCWGTSLW